MLVSLSAENPGALAALRTQVKVPLAVGEQYATATWEDRAIRATLREELFTERWLAKMSPARLARIEMPEPLRGAVLEAQRLTKHEARRRQLQYIGRLMRQVDAESIRSAIEDATGESKQAVALMHRCEKLRDALLADDAALAGVLAELPGADSQQLRATIRAARREHLDGRPPKHARQLYRWLHEQYAGRER